VYRPGRRSVIVLLAIAVVVLAGRREPPPPRGEIAVSRQAVWAERAVDGDTLQLRGVGRVRVIGVNTPEVGQPGYADATEFVRNTCEDRAIEIEVCPVTPLDRYGRLRAVVYYRDSAGREHNLADELIRRRLGHALSIQPCHIPDSYWYDLQSRRPPGEPDEE